MHTGTNIHLNRKGLLGRQGCILKFKYFSHFWMQPHALLTRLHFTTAWIVYNSSSSKNVFWVTEITIFLFYVVEHK